MIATSTEAAAKRFPRSRNRTFGSGYFALVLKYAVPWRVLLYPTTAERDAGYTKYERQSCGAVNCVHDHARVTL